MQTFVRKNNKFLIELVWSGKEKKSLYKYLYFEYHIKVICARSSVDRALASGARCVGSIPIGRIGKLCRVVAAELFCYFRYFSEHVVCYGQNMI